MPKDHWEGFEKEKLFHAVLFDEILSEISAKYGLGLNAAQLTRILDIVNPEFNEGLFERRPCVRALKYKGWCMSEKELACEGNDFFRIGEIYQSVDFNGGTYTITENNRLIGAGYFERVD